MNPEKDGNEHTLFYDTYALYAIAMGEKSYARFASDHRIVTSLMNLYELYHTLLRDGQDHLAETFFQRLLPCCTEITPPIIKKAAQFRFHNSKRKLSYVDCLGYMLAQAQSIHFLTGDPGFKGLPDILFVE